MYQYLIGILLEAICSEMEYATGRIVKVTKYLRNVLSFKSSKSKIFNMIHK